ncbi:sigma-70 family RNA polymerase sigma factor [Nonomuraea sp. NPDC050328]|uniref:sigma-70 family RNA polymerase sigma factor n=1 Tax=Nonomuraea sp. NPDC050328 TaxID=3364361 RepID=UPI0037B503C3
MRTGNASAYGELYQRHVAAARALARHLVKGDAEVEDVVAESFTKILDLVGRGGGPESGFRPYLLTVVRRTVYDRSRVESRQVTTGEIEEFDPGVPFVDPALTGLEKSLVAKAFLSLPERWRAVLWHTEVEDAKPAEVAPLLGLSANGVAALAYRAREGLRQAYLQMHLAATPQQACRPVLGKMGAHVRGGLARRESRQVEDHLGDCLECRSVFLELSDVNRGLRVIVGPLIVGPAFGGYCAGLLKGGGAAGGANLLKAFGWIRRAPKHQQAAMAGGTAAAVAAAAILMLVSGEEPVKHRPPAVQAMPSAIPQPPPPVAEPPPRPEPPPAEPTPAPPPPASPARKPGAARLRATIDPLGALVRSHPGIVAVRLRNEGRGPSKNVVALVDLPPGVTLVPAARRGMAAAPAGGMVGPVPAMADPVGTVDGWSCRPYGEGARCARGPLGAGRATAVFLRVLVAAHAPQGVRPAVRIESGDQQLSVRAVSGVREVGAPARFATDGKVVVRAIGNSLLTCPPDRAGCTRALKREGDRRDNDLWSMRHRDEDDDDSTKASSGARLELPEGGQVVWAGLYWSAGVGKGGPIKFRPPGRKDYVNVVPAQVLVRELPSGAGYQAFADVTSMVSDAARKRGMWWAADMPTREGVSQHAGWSLVVIATDPAQPYSQAVILDTATVVGGAQDRLSLPLGGLHATAASARAELVTWEGDADLSGDRVSLGDGALTPGAGDRDRDNVFDGSSNGADGLTFGVDVDTLEAPLGNDPVLKLATKKDVVLFGVAAVAVPARS